MPCEPCNSNPPCPAARGILPAQHRRHFPCRFQQNLLCLHRRVYCKSAQNMNDSNDRATKPATQNRAVLTRIICTSSPERGERMNSFTIQRIIPRPIPSIIPRCTISLLFIIFTPINRSQFELPLVSWIIKIAFPIGPLACSRPNLHNSACK